MNISKASYTKGLKFLYTNADQLINKKGDLIMFICNDEPDILMFAEVIPKKTGKPNHSCSIRYRWIQARLKLQPGRKQFRCIRKERCCNIP